MDVRLGYIGGIIALIIPFCPVDNWLKYSLIVLGCICFLFAWFFHGINSKINTHRGKTAVEIQKVQTHQKTLELSPDHISILKVFRTNDGELISVPFIEHHTVLETIVIKSILDELKNHKLIASPCLDEFEGGWQYKLTEEGIKTALKFT
jgi:hypothetical protein